MHSFINSVLGRSMWSFWLAMTRCHWQTWFSSRSIEVHGCYGTTALSQTLRGNGFKMSSTTVHYVIITWFFYGDIISSRDIDKNIIFKNEGRLSSAVGLVVQHGNEKSKIPLLKIHNPPHAYPCVSQDNSRTLHVLLYKALLWRKRTKVG